MKQAIIKKGKVNIEKVPDPICGDNDILVKNLYSVISTGTETSSLDFSGKSLVKKILFYPDKISKGLKMVKDRGVAHTYRVVKGMLEFGQPTGYSTCGEVIEAGKNITHIKEGDIVACAGAKYANHAQLVAVPKNLVVKVPMGVSALEAASTTLGSIAMQGVRQANLKVGEWAIVSGLGLLGQITVQILKASGVNVIGLDIEKKRVELAKELGADFAFALGEQNIKKEITRITNGYGADGTLIVASTSSNEPINQAMDFTRKKGVVVVVGAVGLGLKRSPWYEKEIDLKISSSYGPGRYDESYEEKGIDYPHAFVRWTENKNMQAYLELIRSGKVSFQKLVSKIFELDDIEKAYEFLTSTERPMAVAIKYPEVLDKSDKKVSLPFKIQAKKNTINIGIIGAGSFATAVHLPNLDKLRDMFTLKAVATRNGVKARQLSLQYGFRYATTDYKELLKDKEVDAVLIATRHNLHAQMVIDSLRAGKHVFVEKPLALSMVEVGKIEDFLDSKEYQSNPKIFMVGFNRRFSSLSRQIKEDMKDRKSPLIITFRVNDGRVPSDHWVNTEEGGGRMLGNACHMIDLFRYFTDSPAKEVSAQSINSINDFYLATDNFTANISYEDGSVANLVYSSMGDDSLPKEYFEVFCEGKAYIVNDFRSLDIKGGKGGMNPLQQDKGHFEELKAFGEAIKKGEWPISAADQIEVTKTSIEIDSLIRA